MKEEAAVLSLGGGSMLGLEVDSETAGSGMVLAVLMLVAVVARTSLGVGCVTFGLA